MATIRGGFAGAPDIVACYEEAAGGGDVQDINAPRNAPAKDPAVHLDKLVWHSSCFQYELAAGPTNVPVNHASLAAKTVYVGVSWETGYVFGEGASGGVGFNVSGNERTTDILLLNHGLGYVPKAMVALDDRRLPDGWMIQAIAGRGTRLVAPFATSTGIYLREVAISTTSSLPAISKTYTVMVFRTRALEPSEPLFGNPGGNLVLARGIINSSRSYLRRTGAGDSPFSLNLGPTLDIDNGGVRSATGGTVVTDPDYGGGMGAPAYVQVGV